MSLGDRDKLNRIEELKGKLFSKNYQTKIEHRNSFSHLERKDIPDAWESVSVDAPEPSSPSGKLFMKTSAFKNFFIASLAFFVLTAGYASYIFLAGGNSVSNDNIDISIVGNNFVAGGEDLSLIIGITNRNHSGLDLVDLVMEYPKGSSDSGEDSIGTERSRVSLGTIPSGGVRNENVKVVLFGEQGVVRPIKISIEYRIDGSNAIFVKEKTYEVTISSTPLNLSVDAPLSVSPNQDITLNVKATLNATHPVSEVMIQLDYPVGFRFESSDPEPSFGNNMWNLGDFTPGLERDVSISGKILDAFDGEEKSFHISGGSQSTKDKSMIGVVLSSFTHTVAIQKPFLDAKLFVNGSGDREYAVNSQTPIRGEVEWTNNLDTKVSDLQIRVKISGNAINEGTIKGEQGFYNSSQDIIIWDKNSIPDFKEIAPGETGSVKFSFSPLSLLSGTGIMTNPSVFIDVSISGKQPTESSATQDLANSDSGLVRIISDVGFAAKALYFSGPFKNTGPVPPKVEEETTYTIVWSLSNTANNISKGKVTSTLPSWVRFIETAAPEKENLTYNSSTREISWNIGNIPRGTSITEAEREVSFQVGLTPSLSQVGTIPTLVNEAVLTGHDDFANVDIRVNKTFLRTQLSSDSKFPAAGATVIK